LAKVTKAVARSPIQLPQTKITLSGFNRKLATLKHAYPDRAILLLAI